MGDRIEIHMLENIEQGDTIKGFVDIIDGLKIMGMMGLDIHTLIQVFETAFTQGF